jgi:CheY-like chemotaxis protein
METGTSVVLVVDDDPSMLFATETILTRAGYGTLAASSPRQALKHSRDFDGTIHLLLSDIHMPEMDGLMLAYRILAERADTRILLMSALGKADSRLPLLRKPYSMDHLLQQVAHVIDGPPVLLSEVFAGEAPLDTQLQFELTQELTAARRKYLESSRTLLEATKSGVSEIPNPDGTLRIRQQARESQRAFAEYQKARKHLDEHMAALERRSDPEREF